MQNLERRPELGGRTVDANGVNNGLLRCPRCTSRLVSRCGELVERQGADAILAVPHKPSGAVEAANPPDDEAYEWTDHPYGWWWRVGGMDDVDNLGLSRVVSSPKGPLKLAMCVECNYGPVGYQLVDDARIWLACDLLHQQDAALADDNADFAAPENMDMGMLQGMIASGMAIVQFHVTFPEQRLGMCLADAADGQGVEVHAFTEADGQLGPAELSGKVAVGDKVSRINGRSTEGLGYDAVLDMVVEATRPVTMHFARRGAPRTAEAAAAGRITHTEWKGTAEAVPLHAPAPAPAPAPTPAPSAPRPPASSRGAASSPASTSRPATRPSSAVTPLTQCVPL